MKRDAGCMYILTGDIAGFIFFYILFGFWSCIRQDSTLGFEFS